MYSYGPPHMAKQKQDDQLEHSYSSYVRIRDVTLVTGQKRWTIGRSGERGSGISVLAARHGYDDDENLVVFLMTNLFREYISNIWLVGWVGHINYCCLFKTKFSCPVGWGCRIHRLLLCRGVRPPQWVSWYDTQQSDSDVPMMLGALGNAEHPFIAIVPRSTMAWRGSTW